MIEFRISQRPRNSFRTRFSANRCVAKFPPWVFGGPLRAIYFHERLLHNDRSPSDPWTFSSTTGTRRPNNRSQSNHLLLKIHASREQEIDTSDAWAISGHDGPFVYDRAHSYSRYRSLTHFRPTDVRARSRADVTPRIMRPIIYSCQLGEDGQLPPIKMFRPEWSTTRRRRQGDSTWGKEEEPDRLRDPANNSFRETSWKKENFIRVSLT